MRHLRTILLIVIALAVVAANPKFAALDRAIGESGFKMVFLARLSPALLFVLLNYLLGLTKLRTGAYVLANLLGRLPGTFLYVYLGAAAREALGSTQASATGPDKQILTQIGLAATIEPYPVQADALKKIGDAYLLRACSRPCRRLA